MSPCRKKMLKAKINAAIKKIERDFGYEFDQSFFDADANHNPYREKLKNILTKWEKIKTVGGNTDAIDRELKKYDALARTWEETDF